MSIQRDIEGIRSQMAATIHAHWKLVLAQGIVMMVLGFLAVVEPNVATFAVSIFVGWLFFIGGIFRTLSVWRARAMPGFAWALLTALLAIVLGLILIFRPLAGVLTLTMVLIAFFYSRGHHSDRARVAAPRAPPELGLGIVQRDRRPAARLPDLGRLAELSRLGDRVVGRHQHAVLRSLSSDDRASSASDGQSGALTGFGLSTSDKLRFPLFPERSDAFGIVRGHV